jgi:stress response protein SCP2
MNLIKGQKTDITKNNNGFQIQKVSVSLGWSASGVEVDASAFMLNALGKVSSDSDFIFYGQTSSACKSVEIKTISNSKDKQQFQIQLNQVPDGVQKIVFTLTIDTLVNKHHTFQMVRDIHLYVMFNGEIELMRFPITYPFSNETAIVIGELYRYNTEWKFNAVSSGYFGGLAALCSDYGVKVEESSATPVPTPTPLPTQHKPAPSTEPSIQTPNMEKKHEAPVQPIRVELKKKESVNIRKSTMITARLEWKTNKDLDLYCFYVTNSGELGKIYYKNLGNRNVAPYIELDGDSKTHGCETIRIYKPEQLKFILFAAYSAYENGTGSFYSMKAKAIVDNHMGDVVIAPLLESNNLSYWVAIARIDFQSSSQMKVEHVEKYSKSNSENSPLLYADGAFMMDVGPIEFKSSGSVINKFLDFFS